MYRKIFLLYCLYCSLITVVKGQLTLTASDDDGEITSCIATDRPSVVLTCRIGTSASNVYWKLNEFFQATCSYAFEGCSVWPADASHTFSSDIVKGEFNYSIANFSVSDEGNYTCRSGADFASFTAELCVEVRSVTISDGLQNLTTGENLTVTQGEPTTVTCIPGTSRPTPTINWFIDNREQAYSGPSFTFIPNNTLHGKAIRCTAYNMQQKSQAVVSHRPIIFVFVKAASPSLLNVTNDSITFLSGDRNSVLCQSTPTRPAAVITWKIGTNIQSAVSTIEVNGTGGLASVISTLSYAGSKADHNGTLICLSKIPTQNDWPETRKTIKILWEPSTPTIQPVLRFPWLEGETGTLNCITSDRGNPESTVSWTSTEGTVNAQNQLVMSHLNYQRDKLIVNCQLQNQFTAAKGVMVDANITLDVQYKPIVTVSIDGIIVNQITVVEGQNMDAICTAVGNPQPMATWPGTPSLSSGSTLRFRKISRTQAGNYSCQAKATSSAHPSHEFASVQTIQVTVNYPPDARITLETRDQHQIVIKCNADGNPAVYMFDECLHMAPDNSTEIQRYSGDTVGSENILVLKNVTYMDSGYYTCKVSNSITTITDHLGEAERLVSVKEKPVVTHAETMISAGLGDDIRVSVTFFSNDKKEPGVKWFKVANDTRTEIQNVLGEIFHIKTYSDTVDVQYYTKQVTQLGYTSQLALRNLKSTDFGEYYTEMYNSNGTIYHKTSLVPQGAPEEPFSLRVVADSETSSSISFTWLSGYHGGADQTFHIQYKTSDATQWIEGLTVFGGSGVHISFNGTVAGLSEDTAYHFRIYSRNVYGSSHSTDIVYARTSKSPVSSRLENDNNAGAIAGGVIAGVLGLVILILVIVLVLRRFGRLPGIRLYNKEINESRNGSSNYDTINHQNELAETYQELHVTYQTDEQKGDQEEEIRRVSTTRSSLNAYEDLELGKSKGGTNMSPTIEDTSRKSSPKSVIYYNLKLSFD